MKKLIASLATVFFLATVAAPVLAENAKPTTTPPAKTMKHKKTGHKAKKKNMKKVKSSTTPTGK